MEHAWVNSEISSAVLIFRAARNTCCPSTTRQPNACSASSTGISTRSTPMGASSVMPYSRNTASTFAATSSRDPGVGVEGAPQRGDPGPGPLRSVQPWVEQLVVPRRRAEVPQHGLPAPGEHGEPDQLVHRPGADMGGRQVSDVGEVERQ